MYFRSKHTIVGQRLRLGEGEEFAFHAGGPHDLRVRFMASENGADDSVCLAEGSWDPDPTIRTAFTALAEHRLPAGSDDLSGWPWDGHRQPDGSFDENLILPRSAMPESVRSFMTDVQRELFATATRTVDLLRWRCGEVGRHNPFASLGSEWSFDQETWHRLPRDIGMRAEILGPPDLGRVELNDIQRLLVGTVDEPIAHALYREAWMQRHQNPRSALVVGVAALEIGVGGFIREIRRTTLLRRRSKRKLSVVEKLRNQIPKLETRAISGGQIGPLPEAMLSQLEQAVQARHLVVHSTGRAPDSDTVEEMLRAIHDVLWVFDYHRGHGWAMGHVRREVREQPHILASPSSPG